MARRTKIVATLGPASESPEIIQRLIQAGVNVFRFNFSHGSADEHMKRGQAVRDIAARLGTSVAIMGDLQGPKIRIQKFASGAIELAVGDQFALDAELAADAGDQHQVGIDYQQLAEYCQAGDTLLLDDGRIRLTVKEVAGARVNTEVVFGGALSDKKGINRLGGGLSAPALTEKDFADMKTAAAIGVDYIAVSFPSSAADVEQARTGLEALSCDAKIVAKIERAEAVADKQNLDEIILSADAVMVARGDLGVEIGDAELIGVQKYLITRARQLNRCVITATQMMETMRENPMPTRAEVFDVANSVLDGTDAVMLSAETAAGKFPVKAVQAMSDTCIGAEKHPSAQRSNYRLEAKFQRVDEAIAMSTMYAANHLDGVTAIICLTESGATALWVSRISSGLPIYGLSAHPRTLQRLSLYRGVQAVPFHGDTPGTRREVDDEQAALEEVKQRGLIQSGDYVLLTKGSQTGQLGGTDTMKILRA